MGERIDHAAEAVKHIEWAHDQQGTDGEFDFTVRDNALIAQAEATLALVEQQRVANLIAYAQFSWTGDDDMRLFLVQESALECVKQAGESLGLNDD